MRGFSADAHGLAVATPLFASAARAFASAARAFAPVARAFAPVARAFAPGTPGFASIVICCALPEDGTHLCASAKSAVRRPRGDHGNGPARATARIGD